MGEFGPLKKEREAFFKKEKEPTILRYFEASLNFCQKELEEAFEKIKSLGGEEKEIENLFSLKRVCLKTKKKDPETSEMIAKDYQKKVEALKEKFEEKEIKPEEIAPWRKKEVKEKSLFKNYLEAFNFLKDKKLFENLKGKIEEKKFKEINKRRFEVMLKHLVLRDLLKAFSQETKTDPFSQILKEGGILVKFKNKENEKEFIDQGVIKFKLSQKEGEEVIEVEKVSPNLEKFLPKKEFSKKEISSLPLFLQLAVHQFLEKEKQKTGS
ncbi:hypothetical protein J7K91_01570 [bacterium]|nr:hypothetical protein [bacterium]